MSKKYTKEEIEQQGYNLRNRFVYGAFRTDTRKINVDIHFEKAFSQLSYHEQKAKFSAYALTALYTIVDKLRKKKLDYNFDLMLEDFSKLVNEWKDQ